MMGKQAKRTPYILLYPSVCVRSGRLLAFVMTWIYYKCVSMFKSLE